MNVRMYGRRRQRDPAIPAKPPRGVVHTHCQICERDIKGTKASAGSSLIAHHGFKRPGTGWQSSSCEGARELPWEVSCEALRTHVEFVQRTRDETHTRAEGVVTRLVLQVGTSGHLEGRVPTLATVTEETLASVAAEHPQFSRYNGMNFYSSEPMPWPALVERFRKGLRAEVTNLDHYLAHQRRRLAGWKAPP